MSLIRALPLTIAAAMAVGACVPVKEKPRAVVSVGEPNKADVWQGIASPADRQRLANVSGGLGRRAGRCAQGEFRQRPP